MARIERENLGGTSCWSKQHHPLLQFCHGLHNGCGKSGLTCSCRTAQHHDSFFTPVGHEGSQLPYGLLLFGGWHMTEVMSDAVNQFVDYHTVGKVTKYCRNRKAFWDD